MDGENTHTSEFDRDAVGDELDSALGRRGNPSQPVGTPVIGVSQWAHDVRVAIVAHARHDNPILIEGEPGTGKKFLARLIHEQSARRRRPFVTISFESASELTIEAALFGSIRALPSGRNRVQKGKVEIAEGGTLYIEKISALSPTLRVKIARFIQYQEFRRLGDDVLETADVRIILGGTPSSALSPDHVVRAEETVIDVKDALFIPPLRERVEDIEPLSRYFVNQYCQQLGVELRELAHETIKLLQAYHWPGNVEELKQVVRHMVRQSGPPCLDPTLLPAYLVDPLDFSGFNFPDSGIDLGEQIKGWEKSLLCSALKQSRGNQTKAAQLLGIKLSTLNTKIARHNIDVSSFK